MKTFVLGLLVGLTLAGAGAWAQSSWQSFEGTVLQDAARNQQRDFDSRLQQQQLDFDQQLRESEKRRPC